jgi:hypothetical protein
VRAAPKQIKQLLSRNKILSTAVSRQLTTQNRFDAFFAERLEPALGQAVSHYVEQGGKLTVFVASAGWSARMRFALAELWPELQREWPQLNAWAVKIQPAAASEVDART